MYWTRYFNEYIFLSVPSKIFGEESNSKKWQRVIIESVLKKSVQ